MDHEEEQRKKLNRYVFISSILHAVLFLIFTVGAIFGPKPQVFLPSVQIDMVALPTQVKNNEAPPIDTSLPVKENAPEPVKQPEPEPEPAPKEAAPPPPVAKPAKPEPKVDFALEKKKEAEAKKRAEQALKKMRDQLKKERLAEEERKKELQDKRKKDLQKFEQTYRKAISGNQKNDGSSLTGQMQAVANAYMGAVRDKIQANWALPSYLSSQNLTTSVVITMSSDGRLLTTRISKSSGNSMFDENAEAAVRRASPFMPPPAELAGTLRNPGVVVNLTPQ